ncbi:tRNA (adenosine(37)-N6)-threonylcarbamoyltransferase complex dimerization subunit type 1 TsaB [Tepidiforma sp.]|uniref:tRNA (adenosine(37)-N6)-threonylcarbamoyltransferase complex dimerization subunit type 1 TsaB n=1 Tax=Tepidiforma sp. TaxID=2682230 RepID=UPI0026286144|nr:tRNA (adenosine(37)-N6)-threonylcarbamoyltransferase complex dimerization subunit type 1 TsaB [Tepidiforma sp.]MCX7617325.1 tRNA (adenosine(37)-N6)-threonylcarbamoyltransferase complex dimerization subunit type 1 TsaB [Tepidiforma sp.]
MSAILVIDTASDRFAVGVDRDGERAVTVAEEERTHTTGLLSAIEALLGGERPAGIIIVTGPGSYAGLRVGIATAQGLSLATGAPLFGVRTFEAVALAAGKEAVTAIHPAGRGEFGLQRWAGGRPAGDIVLTGELPAGELLAGEGAGARGGIEIGPRERAAALLERLAPAAREGRLQAGAEPYYLREPAITISRRQRAAG